LAWSTWFRLILFGRLSERIRRCPSIAYHGDTSANQQKGDCECHYDLSPKIKINQFTVCKWQRKLLREWIHVSVSISWDIPDCYIANW
jgi:hypothetical protein